MLDHNKPRIIVCQHGARRRYAVARMLERAGMLEALYTDSCEHSFLGKFAKAMGPIAKGSLKRLANRKIEGVPEEKVFASDVLVRYSHNPFIHKSPERLWQSILSEKMKCWGHVSEQTIVYNMYSENLDFMKYSKIKGARIVCDVYINPKSNIILSEEYKQFGLEHRSKKGIDAVSLDKTIEAFAISDLLLCPSTWVAEGLRELCPNDSHKIRICPYGSSIDYDGRVNRPIKGRFFWAGGDWIRKGLVYFAKAADELKMKYPEMEFRAAGIADPEVMKMECFKNIVFLGKLNTQQIQEEFLTADAFVFPALSEGMAGIVLEAVAAGCPIITTKAAGIDAMVHRASGILVPPGDSKAVADSVEEIYIDRKLRDLISKETCQLANDYTEAAWGNRLFKIIDEVNSL
jgi:glycosyltransferase involved in cell wall biosynthesis